jgi:hypothetical protein
MLFYLLHIIGVNTSTIPAFHLKRRTVNAKILELLFGTAKIHPYNQKEVLKWAIKIAERYMGKKNAKAYGRRNSGEGAVVVQINPTKIIAEKDIASWD